MREHHVAVQRVPVLDAGMLDDRISDRVFVLAVELLSTTRTRLGVSHCAMVAEAVASAVMPDLTAV